MFSRHENAEASWARFTPLQESVTSDGSNIFLKITNIFVFLWLLEFSPLSLFFPRFSSVQLLSHVWLFATPWIAAHQASLSITNSLSAPKLMSVELVMPSNHLIFCCSLLLLPSVFPSIREWVSSSHQVAKVLEFQLQHQSFQWTPRTDLL